MVTPHPDKRKKPAQRARPSPYPTRGQIDRQALRDIFPSHPGRRPIRRIRRE
ncbi:MAG: hypothetical protein IPJ89_01025 [Candidatus Iainarchaeum archaeon]|uniref:Uncharacterized protein n=1 Tax=Candidatus Iainarchaeum sp. TaxID=3101447 RepID=A0A7T9I1A0_9ARCH|nr:MAG: hypothetical protein IPJ89_01025 [Candidatus Diapherotrites archaeon]